METNEKIQNYINSLKEDEYNLIYKKETLKPHIIQFKQLITYLNFKILLKEKLSNPNTNNESLKEMYLIDKEWLKKWKWHIGYKEIKAFHKKFKKKIMQIEEKEYDWIEPVIKNNSQIFLTPLNNEKIYGNKNKFDILSEFIIVNKECYSLFSLNFTKAQNKLNKIKNYEVRIFFGKLVLIINDSLNLLKFKSKESNLNFELLIKFEKNNIDINGFFKEISNCNINEWFKKNGFDLYSREEIEFKGLKIINKTLLNKKRKSLDFCKKDIINEDIMKVTKNLSNNFIQSILMNKGNPEKHLLQTRIDKNFENDLKKSKFFNGNKINNNDDLKPNSEIINRKNKNREFIRLSETQANLDKFKDNLNNINDDEYKEYIYQSKEDTISKNYNQPIQNQNIFNIQINNFNNNNNPNNNNNNFICCNNNLNNNNNINNNGMNCFVGNVSNNNYGQFNNINQNMGQFSKFPQNEFMMRNNINNVNMNNNNLNNNYFNFNNNNNFNYQNCSNFNNNCNNTFNNNNFNPNFNNQGNNNIIMPMPALMNMNMNNNINNMFMNSNMNSGNSFNNNMSMNNNIGMNNNFNIFNNNMNMNILNGMNNNMNFNMISNMSHNMLLNNNNKFIQNIGNQNGFNPNNNFINKISSSSNMTMVNILPHKVGLQNIGQTCYMNASLQCLTNVVKLSTKLLLLFNQKKINVEQQPLTYVYSSLLNEFKNTNKSYIIPRAFKATLEGLNPLFQGNQASDAKDFIFFMIERLHQELKPPEKPLNNFGQIDFLQQEMEAQNQMLTLNKFLIEFGNNSSIISETFYGITSSIMKCEGCNSVKHSFQTFNILNFILKKVKDDKRQEFGAQNLNNDVINLYDAFYSENKKENLTGENMIYCNTCRALKNGWVQQSIYQLPQIMIIILNRGRNNKDFREEFKIDEILDFNNTPDIFCNIDNKRKYKRYFLCGIIKHLGESGANGHFISYYRNSLSQKFYCYNDASVAEVSVEDALKTKISHNDKEDIIPYILFYHYKN